MKPGKVLCYRFLSAILGVDRAQNLTKYNSWSRVFAGKNQMPRGGLIEPRTPRCHGRRLTTELSLVEISAE